MKALLLAAALAATCAAATWLSHAVRGNRIELRLSEGAAEIEWISPSTFRFRRAPAGALPQVPRPEREMVAVKLSETPDALRFATRYLDVTIRKSGLLLKGATAGGEPLMEDLTEAHWQDGVIAWERAAQWGAEFYGLGPRPEALLNALGRRIEAAVPFLFSTAGYGEHHTAPGRYTFDLRPTDRYRVEIHGGRLIDFTFYYGPTPKEVFEEHLFAGAEVEEPPAPPLLAGNWSTLRDGLVRLAHAGFSGILRAGFDGAPYRNAPAALRERAQQLAGAVNPGVRKELVPYFFAYQQETRERGLPIVRPLAFQFPSDPQAARHTDEFMVGDELLAAPIYTAAEERSLYLPQGIWTRLDTNESFRGRQTIQAKGPGLPLFARNGSILPLQGAVLELHYFPKLGAEFFLYEDEYGDYSQAHAAPAADIMRLEIESRRGREYEWVVHHVDHPRQVGFEDQVFAEVQEALLLAHGKWFHDAAKGNLHVRARVAAGEDCIINLTF